MFDFSVHTTFYHQLYDHKVLTHQYQNIAKNFVQHWIYIMYKGIHNNNNELNIKPIDIKEVWDNQKASKGNKHTDDEHYISDIIFKW